MQKNLITTNPLLVQLEGIVSEGRNANTMDIDILATEQILQKINAEDKLVADAVEKALSSITEAVDAIFHALSNEGRLIYLGAGTSGRLGILDAVECRPTFSVSDNIVMGIIAGGQQALTNAVEGAEDDINAAAHDLQMIHVNQHDIVVGIAASGRTPYVIGGLNFANSLGCKTITLVCNPGAPLLDIADIGICVNVGPECLTGSTRMKSGSAQKLVLNMLSTASMIKLGKAYQNLMIDVNASNQKLVARAINIVMQATHCDEALATKTLSAANNSAKLAILMILTDLDASYAKQLLADNKGYLRKAASQAKKGQ